MRWHHFPDPDLLPADVVILVDLTQLVCRDVFVSVDAMEQLGPLLQRLTCPLDELILSRQKVDVLLFEQP